MNLNYDEVLAFASEKHYGQFRADGVTPYIEHPKKVAELIMKYKHSSQIDVLVAGALLHDTLEDTYTSPKEIEDNFGEKVASLVLELTSASYFCRMSGKVNYLCKKMVNMSNYALAIKLADRLANLMDSKNLTKEKQIKLYDDTYKIINYLLQQRDLTPSHIKLISAIEEELNIQKNNKANV